ncbi:5'-3' exonuclease [Naumannella halotolerans]|nr:5'-3' exonuclease H3TH domain-containing protein [Naumannella halotolerans]
MPDPTTPELLMVVDGNSLLHRSFHALAASNARNRAGEPIWAIRGLLTQLVVAAERIGPQRIIVGFDDPDRNWRRERWPHYKAQRAEKLPSLDSQLLLARAVLDELGVQVVCPEAQEADDVLASVSARAGTEGGQCVVVTSDRDAFCLINSHTRVLRVINGGVDASPVLTPERLQLMIGIGPQQYPDFAALRGDPSDNLPGVRGIGPKRAVTLLTEVGDGEQIFADAESGGELITAALSRTWAQRLADPTARQVWQHNRQVMQMRHDLDLGPLTDRGRLPLSAAAVRQVLLDLGLPATARTAARVLAEDPNAETESATTDSLGWQSRAQWQGARRSLPALPVNLQPTLF